MSDIANFLNKKNLNFLLFKELNTISGFFEFLSEIGQMKIRFIKYLR